MMKTCKEHVILWFAHVLPLYTIIFDLLPEEAMGLYKSLDLDSLLLSNNTENGNGTGGTATKDMPKSTRCLNTVVKGVNQKFLKDPSRMGCVYIHPFTGVPETK
jgi:hypothetical protein